MRHKKCTLCEEIGHKPDMIKIQYNSGLGIGYNIYYNWFHKKCFKKLENKEGK